MYMRKKDTRGGQNRVVNYNPFKRNRKDAQYWIGYLLADGNISSKKYSISVQSADIDHMLTYRDFVHHELKVYDRLNAAGTLMRTVLFGNYEVYHYLLSLGFTPNKSKTLQLKIPLTGSILRGIFDGDGSVSQGRPKITTASPYFVEQLTAFYECNEIDYTVTVKDKRKAIKTYDVWTLYNSRQKMFDLMYPTVSCVKLERKYIQFRAALPKGKVKNIG